MMVQNLTAQPLWYTKASYLRYIWIKNPLQCGVATLMVENSVSWDSLYDPGRLGAWKMLSLKCVTEAGQWGLQLYQQPFGTAGGKHDGVLACQFRFTQAAAPGHCCWWCNFTTEVCVLSYRDGSLTTRNSSSHCVSCFLNSLTMKSLWHCFLTLRFPAESQNAAVPISVIVTGAYLHVDSRSTKACGQAPQRSGKRQSTLDLHELKENQF